MSAMVNVGTDCAVQFALYKQAVFFKAQLNRHIRFPFGWQRPIRLDFRRVVGEINIITDPNLEFIGDSLVITHDSLVNIVNRCDLDFLFNRNQRPSLVFGLCDRRLQAHNEQKTAEHSWLRRLEHSSSLRVRCGLTRSANPQRNLPIASRNVARVAPAAARQERSATRGTAPGTPTLFTATTTPP